VKNPIPVRSVVSYTVVKPSGKAKVEVPKELAYRDIDTQDIGGLEVEKARTSQVPKQ
jgi:hypothetical protein